MMSIGFLAVAMMAALYSSAAGRDGRVLAAMISALLALGIALSVAIRLVPRLARHVDWGWLPFFSHYHVTNEGWMYFAAVTVVLFAAINTANNLLYMVLSGMLAVLALSGFLSALNLQQLRFVARIPSRCYAGEPFPIHIQLENDKRFFPTFSLSFGPAVGSAFRFSTSYVAVVRSREHAIQAGQALLPKRGQYSLREVAVSSRYPFGFFFKDRRFAAEAQCICYPEILPEEQIDLASMDLRGTDQRFQRGFGSDLYMIRDYVPSDSTRHVHWKASAKTSVLKTREYAAEESRRVTLAFDRYGNPGDDEQFERLVSYAASLAYHLIESGIEVNFMTDTWQSTQLEAILEYLALVSMSDSADLPPIDMAEVTLSLRG